MINLNIGVYNQKGEELNVKFMKLDYGLVHDLIIIVNDDEEDNYGFDELKALAKKIRLNEIDKSLHKNCYSPVTNGHCFDW